MAVYVDLICEKCGEVIVDQWSTNIGRAHITSLDDDSCDGYLERFWSLSPAPAPGTHHSERVVVYESAKEGKIQYPGRNDTPVPERLRARGYVRRELNVSELRSFEKRNNVVNERRYFDRNGKGF